MKHASVFDANTRSWPPESVAHQIGLHLSRFQIHDHDAALVIGDEDTAVELSVVFWGNLALLAVGGEMKNEPVRQLYNIEVALAVERGPFQEAIGPCHRAG